ncbi:MAG: DUF1822 family protein [Xenococcaceae cyanobacterium MO_167.B52]|nr:DUF1822 family protein [Xenococcaceae cyanobacterium MO_167.B52]
MSSTFYTKLDEEPLVILVLKITAEATETTDICLQLYPAGNNNNLPINLSVKVLAQADKTCLSATTTEEDDWIQVEFACYQGENFKIELNLAGIIITEKFSIENSLTQLIMVEDRGKLFSPLVLNLKRPI